MTKSGCFSRIGRMLLCQGSLQKNHPSDRNKESKTSPFGDLNKAESEKPQPLVAVAAAAAAPGVVARLMGLESIPLDSRTPPDCVRRSRSVNFVDYLLQFDLTEQEQEQEREREQEDDVEARHRRIRSSVSFREVPELLNQNMFVLYLRDSGRESDNKTKKTKPQVGSRPRTNMSINHNHNHRHHKPNNKKVMGQEFGNNEGENNQPKRISKGNSCSKKQQPSPSSRKAEVSSAHKKIGHTSKGLGRSPTPTLKPPINEKEVLVESQFMKKIKKTNKKLSPRGEAESVFSSEGSSPVSVLDLKEAPVAFSAHVKLNHHLISKKKSSHRIGKSRELEPRGIKTREELAEDRDDEFFTQLTWKLLVLAEEDVIKSNWVAKAPFFGFQCFEDICFEFGQEILDFLLFQLVQELLHID